MIINFYKTDEYKELHDELLDCDVDDVLDIIADIEDAKIQFERGLPCFVKIRWSDLYLTDPIEFKKAYVEYNKKLINGEYRR